MAEGTVRGAFDLDTRPAIRGVRDYTREAVKADAATKRLGSTIDNAFGPSTSARIDEVARSTRDLASTTTKAHAEISSDWRGMRRDMEAESALMVRSIDAVHDRMRALGRETARPHVDMTGVSEALAQVELLESRLDKLSRQRATPRVSLGGGFAGTRTGGFGSAAARARSGASGAGRAAGGSIAGGRGGGGGSGFSSAARAASSGGSIFSALPGGAGLAAVAAGALPVVQALTGATVALGGSLVGAGLGAGATALAGGGLLAVGIGSILAVAKPATVELQKVMKAQQAYNAVVAQYGQRSRQAAAARIKLNEAERAAPGSGRAVRNLTGFQNAFRTATAPGRRSFYGLVGDVGRIGQRTAPLLGQDANTVLGSVRSSGTRFARFLAGSQTQDTLSVFSTTFARELPTAERTLQNVTSTLEHLSRSALPFFHDANVWVEHWTQGWASSTRDISSTRDKMRPLVQSFKDWRDLTGATLRTVRDLFTLGEPAGDSMVVRLTDTFDRWDAWIKANPQKVQSFFRDTVSSTEKMAGALGKVVHFLNDMATLLRPLLDRFSQLVGLASSLGLIGTPGAAAAVFGAYRGLKGGGGGGGAARAGGGMLIGGGGRGGGGLLGGSLASGGGAAAASYLAAPSSYGVASGASSYPVSDTRSLLLATAMRPTVGAFGGVTSRVGGGVATPEAFAARYGSVEGARYAMPVMVGQRTGMFSGAAGRLRAGAAGAAKAALPAIALVSALDAASTQGTMFERFSQGLSTASFGLIPAELPQSTLKGQGAQAAAQFVQGLPQASTPAQARMNLQAIGQQIRSERGLLPKSVAGAFEQPFLAQAFGIGKKKPVRGQVVGTIDALTQAQQDETRALQALTAARNRELDALSRQRATQFASGLGGAFSAFRRGGQSQETAAMSTEGLLGTRLKRVRAAGVETLGEAGLAWAKALEKAHPQITGVVDRMTKDIEDRYRKMGKRVEIVNGNILTGTKSEWGGIRDAMSGAMEQAREQLSRSFTAIQQQAVGSLIAMGFSRSEARGIVQGMENGGAARSTATLAVGAKGTAGGIGNVISGAAAGSLIGTKPTGKKGARGGMFAGMGVMDTVPLPGGGTAAPGEGWIANRHTLADISRATRAMYGVTAQQMITSERRPHWRRYALGGPGGGGGGFAAAPGSNFSVGDEPRIAADLGALGRRLGVVVTGISGYRSPAHSVAVGGFADDPHTQGAAADIGVPGGFLSSTRADAVLRSVGLYRPFYPAQAKEINHVQLLAGGGGGARGAAGVLAGLAAGSVGSVHLRAPGVSGAGVPAALLGRGGQIYAAGLQRQINRRLRSMGGAGGGDLSGFSGGGDAAANRALGRRMMLAFGYPGSEWGALDKLWTRESGWSSTAVNKSSGAAGIPQALGHGNVFSLGDAAAQIGWGLRYIKGRYGSPSAAWGHEQSSGWYARGGRYDWAGGFRNGGSFVTNGPTAFVAGEGHRRRERVTVTPASSPTPAGGHHVVFQSGSIVVQVTAGSLADDAEIAALAEKVGVRVASKITEAIRKGSTAGVID